MRPNEIINICQEWIKQLKLEEINTKDLSLLTIEELSSLLDKLSSIYYRIVYIKSSIEAKLSLLRSEFNKQVHIKTIKCLINQYKYATYQERLALVLSMSKKLQKKEEKIAVIQYKFNLIKDLPRVIENKFQVVRRAYETEQRGGS